MQRECTVPDPQRQELSFCMTRCDPWRVEAAEENPPGLHSLRRFEAVATAGFVRFACSQQDAIGRMHNPLRMVGGCAAHDANRVEFGHVLGDGHQLGDRLERRAAEILIEAGHDHPMSCFGQCIADSYEFEAEKLCLVDAHDVGLAGEEENLLGGMNDGRGEGRSVMRDDGVAAESRVERRFENAHRLAGDTRAFETADEFFGLPAEHGTANDFDPPDVSAMQDIRFHRLLG